MSAESKERCGLCRFWPRHPHAEMNDLEEGISGSYYSECRRRAPVLDPSDTFHQPTYPKVYSGHWCGEFEPRPSSNGTEVEP